MGHPLFGLCLDVGHRELFSRQSVGEWVHGMHPHIFELHLHDNRGVNDDHFPIGDGKVDFGGLFKKLDELGVNPVYTLEAHSPEDAVKSLKSLSKYL
jgi:sugar phosphate isomerase/epimerase